MARVLWYRLWRGALTVWFVLTVAFVAPRLTGDPARSLLPENATAAERAELRARLGLDQPLARQYLTYLGNVLRGDFGDSFAERRPAARAVIERVPATLELGVVAFALSLLLGVGGGVLAAQGRGGPWDRSVTAAALLGQAVPNFVLGVALILVFSLALRWLPSGGREGWHSLVMPALTLAAGSSAWLMRLTRGVMLDLAELDFVRTARAKGAGAASVAVKHVLRNACLPVLTLLGLRAGALVAGSVVVETVFAWPGVGRLLVTSVAARDFPVIQFAVVLISASVVAANLVVDLLYGVADPRVRAS
ncbi:MAG TPA: ABC transporter permease [Trueperaceae bacterium]